MFMGRVGELLKTINGWHHTRFMKICFPLSIHEVAFSSPHPRPQEPATEADAAYAKAKELGYTG
jgi:hypothetical protein